MRKNGRFLRLAAFFFLLVCALGGLTACGAAEGSAGESASSVGEISSPEAGYSSPEENSSSEKTDDSTGSVDSSDSSSGGWGPIGDYEQKN